MPITVPSSMRQPQPHRCGICKAVNKEHHYNPARNGYVQGVAWLCVRCDLTPDPPIKVT